MKVFIFDVRSTLNRQKRLDLVDYVLRNNFDIILVTETWLTKSIKNAELFFSNYKMIRADRHNIENPAVSKHGGCPIATGKWIPHEELDLGEFSDPRMECLVAIEVTLKVPFLIVLINNPPEKNPYRLSESQLKIIFQFLSNKTKGCLLLFGDFNLPKMDWSPYYSSDIYEKIIDN